MRNYLLAVHIDESASAPADEQVYQRVDAFNAELQSAGAWVFAGGAERAFLRGRRDALTA
jgi:hypothetical protein